MISTDGVLLGKEAKILLKKLTIRLAEKCWEKAYSKVCRFASARCNTILLERCLERSMVDKAGCCLCAAGEDERDRNHGLAHLTLIQHVGC